MIVKKVLKIKDRALYFGVVSSEEEKEEMYKQRYTVYSKYEYINEKFIDGDLEIDKHDAASTYIIAKDDEDRLVASVRIIKKKALPIFSAFNILNKQELIHQDSEVCPVEFSRLVVDRKRGDDDYIPRNILILFLMRVALSQVKDTNIIFAYLKESLWKKVTLLKIPFTQFSDYRCIYPKEDLMSGYFYKNGVVIPGFFKVIELEKYVNNIINNNKLFSLNTDNVYTLNDSFYISMLRKLGIL